MAEKLAERIRAAVTYQYMPMAVRTLLAEAATVLDTATPDRSDDALAEENGRLREGLERVASDCQFSHDALGNSPPQFDSVAQAFLIVRDRARAALKGHGL